MCIAKFFLITGFILLSGSAAENGVTNRNESEVYPLFVGLLAVVIVVLAVLSCAGESKVASVEPNDKGKIKGQPVTKAMSPQRNSGFQDIEFSKPKKVESKKVTETPSSTKQVNEWSSNNAANESRPRDERKTNKDETATVFTYKDETSTVFIRDEEHKAHLKKENKPSTSKMVGDAHASNHLIENVEVNQHNTMHLKDDTPRSNFLSETSSSTPRIDVTNRQVAPSSVNNRHIDVPRNNGNRHNREDTGDDFGYHSDFSRGNKPDTDSSHLSTFRSSQLPSNHRSAASNDADDDAIETYNDDGESIDWN